MPLLLGERDEVLRAIEAAFPAVDIHVRGNEIVLDGDDDLERVARLLEDLLVLVEQGHRLEPGTVRRSVEMVRANERPAEVLSTEVLRPARGRPVRPKSSGQKRYVDAIRENVITFGVGPAGTGKSWLAVAMAVQALQSKDVDRIILTRPAVEAGERLGFLPGTLTDKIDPYLRPLYDALNEMMDPEIVPRLMATGTIEVAPLAYMRGRTLNDSFVVLDEAQNTTPEQMMMFLTRLGEESRMVVTGDITQIDLPRSKQSGLMEVRHILADIPGIDFHTFSGADIVRHPLVQKIIDAYDAYRNPIANANGAEGKS
jgi:phosphate starvation-inducible PhoH-like protein